MDWGGGINVYGWNVNLPVTLCPSEPPTTIYSNQGHVVLHFAPYLFPQGLEKRVWTVCCRWMEKEENTEISVILDIGKGNGILLIELVVFELKCKGV